jgi:nicotinamide riboside kinase
MYRIGFIGVPSTGKTTLARALSANAYKMPEFARTELVSEYARRFIVEYGTDVTLMDQFRIIKKQCEWEDRVPVESTDLIITDSPIHISFMYSLDRCDGSKKDVLY